MSTEIRVPQLPESVADATLVAWHKQPGEAIRRDENLADLETDKVVLEVPAPANGVVRELRVQSGAVVKSGELLAIIEEGGAVPAAPSATASTAAARAGSQAPATAQRSPAPPAASAPPAAGARPAAATDGNDEPGAARDAGKLSPAVRRLLEENRLDPSSIRASGRDGRLTKSDVVDFLGRSRGAEAPAQPAKVPAMQEAPPARAPAAAGERVQRRVPMTRLRVRIAERLVQAQAVQALLTTFNEVDLSAIQELRARHKERFEKEHGVKLGFMSFFVKAAVAALQRFPVVNASVDGNDIVYHEYYDIGVAVSTERGLIVPIVRDADRRSFADLETQIAHYARQARDGSLAIEDLTGGTFTVTNGGVFGSLLSTPIVNAPQSAILGMHRIQERPVVVQGAVAVRPMMYLAVTYDHRIIDGREAVQFLVAIKDALEDPGRMLLGV